MNYRARSYDPRVGRFIQKDPLPGNTILEHYVYARNAPTQHIDPSGLQAEEVVDFDKMRAQLADLSPQHRELFRDALGVAYGKVTGFRKEVRGGKGFVRRLSAEFGKDFAKGLAVDQAKRILGIEKIPTGLSDIAFTSIDVTMRFAMDSASIRQFKKVGSNKYLITYNREAGGPTPGGLPGGVFHDGFISGDDMVRIPTGGRFQGAANNRATQPTPIYVGVKAEEYFTAMHEFQIRLDFYHRQWANRKRQAELNRKTFTEQMREAAGEAKGSIDMSFHKAGVLIQQIGDAMLGAFGLTRDDLDFFGE